MSENQFTPQELIDEGIVTQSMKEDGSITLRLTPLGIELAEAMKSKRKKSH